MRETTEGLRKAGAKSQATLRDFDRRCLALIEPLQPEDIKKLREASQVSQAVFAHLLNTSLPTLRKWETGQTTPTGAALKLLHLVRQRGIELLA